MVMVMTVVMVVAMVLEMAEIFIIRETSFQLVSCSEGQGTVHHLIQ